MNSVITAYGCNSCDNDIRHDSSSGGLFSVLAMFHLKNGGVVYGTAMSEDCKKAVFRRVVNPNELENLRGSKYLQSVVGDTYKQVLEDLQKGVQVFFSGCPCQVNGLKLFLGKEYNNLFCMDIICHGVPSPELWKKYAENFEKKNRAILKSVNFRSKEIIWGDDEHHTDWKRSFSIKHENPYMLMFLRNYSLRPSCYECKAKAYRLADITIGDFWGIEYVLPELNDTKGTSLVLIRSVKGEEKFDAILHEINYMPCDYEKVIQKNTSEYLSARKPPQREEFFVDMNKLSYTELEKKYLGSAFIRKTKKLIKKVLGKDNNNVNLTNSDYGMMLFFHEQ